MGYCTEIDGQIPALHNYGRFRYDRQAFYSSGLVVYYDSSEMRCRELHAGRFTVVMSGQVMRSLEVDHYTLIKKLVGTFWLKATRIDLAFDDFERKIEPFDVAQYTNNGMYTRFRVHEPFFKKKRTGEYKSAGVAFGSRSKNGGGLYVRCYDKGIESKGEINSVRWESEFSKEKAQSVVFELYKTGSLDEMVSVIASLIGGSIDFVDRASAHLDRAKRLSWWQEILDILGSATFETSRRIKTVEKAQTWVECSVAPSLKMLQVALGREGFSEWLETVVSSKQLSIQQMRSVNEYYNEGVPF